MNRRLVAFGSVAFLAIATLLAATLGAQGAAPARAVTLRQLEEQLRTVPSATEMAADERAMTKEPHHAGTEAQRRTAEYDAGRLREWGYDVKLYEYDVLVPYPKERKVELVAPEAYTLPLDEPPIAEDPDTSVVLDPVKGALPPFNAYTPSGNVTGELVYANYGLPGDYDRLAALGVDVKGKIVLTRYGATWRGIKPKVAAEHGAIACLIYSDPKDDGFVRGEVYPKGPWRPEGAVQRGSVMDMPRYPGDPTTPGEASKGNVKRIPLDQVTTLSPIPVHPLNYRDALPLLKALGGPVAPDAWKGGLPIAYHVGPGPARVHVKLEMDYALRPIVNVIGWLRGREEPDRWVMAGGHRDAWTFGGRDPISGAASLLETARAIGTLAQSGWRPRRTIAFASWDGEDYGLLGSTEWVEEFARDAGANGVVYINRESYVAGPFGAEASHSLAPFLYAVTRDGRDPGKPERSLYDAWLADEQPAERQGRPAEGRPSGSQPNVGALGSGSDYTAFLDHAGVSSIDLGFNGPNGLYHSLYDTRSYFEKFGDPGFTYGVELARVVGVMVLRLAEQPVLPFDHRAYANQILRYVGEIEKLGTGKPGFDAVPITNVRAAAEAFGAAGDRANARAAALGGTEQDRAARARLNAALLQVERDLLDERGLPDRPWFRHLIYAPGFYTGYAVKTLPGVREAIESGRMDVAAEQARRLEEALRRAARTLEQGAATSTQ